MTVSGLAHGDSVLAQIRSLAASLSKTDRRVVNVILEDPERVVRGTISDLADSAAVSPSSVVRTCQRLGYSGFGQARISLARELGMRSLGAGLNAEDNELARRDIVAATFAYASRSLAEAPATVDRAMFNSAVDAITKAERVLVAGVGTSAPLAFDCAYRLRMLGVRAEYPGDPHVQDVAARQLGADDVALVISHTGSTRESISSCEAARRGGALIVGVTSFGQSPLTRIADLSLVATCGESVMQLEAMTSRLVHLALLDALIVSVGLKLGAPALHRLSEAYSQIAAHRF